MADAALEKKLYKLGYSGDVLRTKKYLNYWINIALDFNIEAKATKKKK